MDFNRDGLIELFFEEASEHLGILEEGLLALEKNPRGSFALIDRLFRSAHTVKGSAGLMGFPTISRIAHLMEDSLELIRDRRVSPPADAVDSMLFALDHIRRLTGADQCEAVDEDLIPLISQRLEQACAAIASATPLPADQEQDELAASEDPLIAEHRETDRRSAAAGGGMGNQIRVDASRIESMMQVLGDITITKTHLLNQLKQMEQVKDEIRQTSNRLNTEVSRFSEKYAYSLPEQKKRSDEMMTGFAELEFDQYDEINLFSRKLQEITSDVNEAMRVMNDYFGQFALELQAMERMTGDLKEQISDARTVPAAALFQRFTRTIRELARGADRQIELVVSGGETLIDRAIYDGLYDPLLHIIRNAVSHGFEPVQERATLGKPELCTISLSAHRRGNRVEIEVHDDGRGIQLDRIRQRALEIGLLRPGQDLAEKALVDLIFKPGFSTNEQKDMVSGRGVGMNVVMDRLSALNGTIEVQTRPGEGTLMRLNLPLSLIIVNVVQFRIGEQALVLPSSLISELVHLDTDRSESDVLEVRGEELPLLDLNRILGWPRRRGGVPRFAIVTQSSGVSVALLVEEILSQEDTVIKPLSPFLAGTLHVAGTSLSGDGTLRLVLNPARLNDAELQKVGSAQLRASQAEPCVLVVDDSLSVRKYATGLLEAKGLRVLTATNGIEALDVLDAHAVALVLTDLEMPVMHGYELLSELGRRGRLGTLPVAVLTSRAGDQHRRKAFDLGAIDYLVKPFDEEMLMALVNKFTDLPSK